MMAVVSRRVRTVLTFRVQGPNTDTIRERAEQRIIEYDPTWVKVPYTVDVRPMVTDSATGEVRMWDAEIVVEDA